MLRATRLRFGDRILAGLMAASAGLGGIIAASVPPQSVVPAVHAAQADRGSPRVFFVSPRDGAELSTDEIQMEFGVEGYEISPVPEDFETPRSGIGHYHLGVDTGCFAIGEVIPPGQQGWVHFGDGSNEFSMQVEPGSYELSVQIGDDEHRTQEGLCQTITVQITAGD